MKNYRLALLIIYLCGLFTFALNAGYDNRKIIGINSKGEEVYPIAQHLSEVLETGSSIYYTSKDGKKMYDIKEIAVDTFVKRDFFMTLFKGFVILFIFVLLLLIIESIRKWLARKKANKAI